MNREQFIKAVKAADKRTDVGFGNNLEDRKLDEWRFHDALTIEKHMIKDTKKSTDEPEVSTDNLKYYKTTNRSIAFVENWLSKNTKGKICLDYACGEGRDTLKIAGGGGLTFL